MIAASAPENGVSVEWAWEIIEEPSFGEYIDDGRGARVCSVINGDCGAPPAPAIIGDAEPIEPRCEVPALRIRLARFTRRNARTQRARIAKKPRTTMTAMPQCGNEDWELDCKLPGVGVLEERDAAARVEEADAADNEDAESAATDDDEAMEDVRESAYVV